MDPELQGALDRLTEDLRGEIRAGNAETRTYVDGRVQTLGARLDGRIDALEIRFEGLEGRFAGLEGRFEGLSGRFDALTIHIESRFGDLRRHFDVMAESVRGDIRSLAELMAISIERTDGRINEQAGRVDGLEGRVLGLEVRVTRLEEDRPSRRSRRPR